MLIYSPKGSLAGLPDEPPVAPPPGKEILPVNEWQFDGPGNILPSGGLAILNSQEQIAKQPSKEADELIQKLLTEDAKTAIRWSALSKYLAALIPILVEDKAFRQSKLLDFTSRLHAWLWMNQVYWLAANEIDDKKTTDSIAKMVSYLLDPRTLPEDSTVRVDVMKLIDEAAQLKKAETNLMLAQVNPNGGGTFPLDEWHMFGNDSKSIGWYGPVAMRARVAQQQDTGKGIKYVYPVPNIPVTEKKHVQNPMYYGLLVGYADNKPYDKYGKDGADIAPFTEAQLLKSTVKETLVPGPASINPYLEYQARRMYDIAPGKDVYDALKEISESLRGVGTLDEMLTVGGFVKEGRNLDPEWAGTSSGTVTNPPVYKAFYGVVAKLRTNQDLYRIQMDKKAVSNGFCFGGPADTAAWGQYLNKLHQMEDAVAFVSFFPVVLLDWSIATGLKPDFNEWKSRVIKGEETKVPGQMAKIADKSTKMAIESQIEYMRKEMWAGVGPSYISLAQTLVDALEGTKTGPGSFADWTVGKSLPFPLVYTLDARAVAQQPFVANNLSAIALSADQSVLINYRSDYKSTLLVGMKAAEIAGKTTNSLEGWIERVQELVKYLLGAELSMDVPEGQDAYEYYKKQALELVDNPKGPDSLCFRILQKVAQQQKLYNEIDALKPGTYDPVKQSKILILNEEINTLRREMQILLAEVFGILFKISEFAEGGALAMLKYSIAAIKKLEGFTGKVKIGNIEIFVIPTKEEEDAKAELIKKVAELVEKLKKILAWSKALADALYVLAKKWGMDLSDGIEERLDKKEEEKKSNLWLLLLLAAAAASREK